VHVHILRACANCACAMSCAWSCSWFVLCTVLRFRIYNRKKRIYLNLLYAMKFYCEDFYCKNCTESLDIVITS